MVKRNKIFALCTITLVVALSGVLLTACSNGQSSSSTNGQGLPSTSGQTQTTAFSLGHLNSTAHVLAFVAQEEGYFKDEGLDVSLYQLKGPFVQNGH